MINDGASMVSVVIAAAGKGSRMGTNQNKQYMELLGEPVLARTVKKFEDCGRVDEIIIAAAESDLEYCKEKIVREHRLSKVKAVTAGGASRQESVYNALLKVSEDCGIVLIHDGARPFIDTESINACIDAAEENRAACAAVPVKDTIKSADAGGFVRETMDRSCLWSIQTPQAFQYELIMEAHRRARIDGFEGTDDAILAERLGIKVKLISCSYYNIKITTKEDLALAEFICKYNKKGLGEW